VEWLDRGMFLKILAVLSIYRGLMAVSWWPPGDDAAVTVRLILFFDFIPTFTQVNSMKK
jgi:hypothetical protein